MSTEFKLYNVDDKDLYKNQSPERKAQLQPEIIKMAKERGIKPTARYYNTYPATIRRIIEKYENNQCKEKD